LKSKGRVIGRRGGVLSRSAEEEESEAEHVEDCKSYSGAMLPGEVGGMVHNRNGDGLDSIRGRVGPGVTAELTAEAEFGLAGGGQPRVRGPHACKGLTHGTKGLLHCARLDRQLAGGNDAFSIAFGKHL
jgi:hypothetical protein